MLPTITMISWRQGPDGSIRPRFTPGPAVRALGFEPRSLRDGAGKYMTFEQVREWMTGAGGMLEQIAKARDPDAPRAPRKVPQVVRHRTMGNLLEDWWASEDVRRLTPKTIDGYRKQVASILYKPRPNPKAPLEREAFSLAPVEVIGAIELKSFFDYSVKNRGLHMARASVAVISAAMSWGTTDKFWRLGTNPRLGMKFTKPKPRVVIWTDTELRAMIAAADAIGRPSIGDAIVLGLFTAQRQNDRLALQDGGLVEGRRRFRQGKTGAIVDIPETPRLRERLEEARTRARAVMLRRGVRSAELVIDETTGKAWNSDTYRHEFSRVRATAIAGLADVAVMAVGQRNDPETAWLLEPCPSIGGKRESDLRDTAVTWLARAGATLPEIASISGHSMRSIHTILAHYLAITPELADQGVKKLLSWMETNNMHV